MAKQPETIDRYRIFAETSIEQMGFVLAALTKMGLEKVGYELITDVVNFKEKKVHDVKSEDFAKVFLEENPTFRAIDLVNYFRAAGRTPGAAYTVIRNLVDTKVLRKIGPANYQRADVKALAPPSMRGKHGKTATYDMPNKDLITKFIKGRKKVTMRELRDLFVKEGRNEKSISPILTVMTKAKAIKVVASGQYEVLQKAAKPTAAVKKPAAKAKPAKEKKAAEASAPAHTQILNGGEMTHG